LVNRLPLVHAALWAGRLDHHKARVFADYLADLTDRQIAVICSRLVGPAEGWTTGQLAHRLLREVLAVDRSYARKKYQAAVRERGVTGHLAPDGTATMTAHGLTPTEAAAAAARVEDLADVIRRAGHPGTVQQVRADLFVRLLDGSLTGLGRAEIIAVMVAEGRTAAAQDAAAQDAAARGDADAAADGEPSGSSEQPPPSSVPEPIASEPIASEPTEPEPQPSAHGFGLDHEPVGVRPAPAGPREGVVVRVGVATLLGFDDHPAELPRWGPVLAEQARELVRRQRSAQWWFAITDPDGYLIHGGITTRRAYPATPGSACRGGVVEIHLPLTLLQELAARSDLPDHWAAVITDIANQYLCAFHHALEHRGGWRLWQPVPGQFVWRSPLGRVYRTRGAPIGPDLPEPISREEEPEVTDRSGAKRDLPILEPPCPHEPDPPPPPAVDLDDLPPF
ncbi:hypothetical protein ACFPFQ_04900, partial [Pseudonocardia sp. GCM10023141]